ncbi:hypothetical protein [Parasitella parasitica]|uniref:Pleckstrin homology domain-containing protein n=1 Tax=Parasitella parasitica TaxID=35722 RepID=A0A0B7NL08_9FUNG|nr:hypothetical protein [Parasitella parasitica]
MNVNQVKLELAAQLEDKEKLLGKTGTSQISRNALIKQADVIRKELLVLNQYEQQDELPDDIRSKLEDLANEVQSLKSSKSTSLHDKNKNSSPLSLPPAPTNSSPSKQRTKITNGNRRNPDIEFATEIGQGLLIEVRKLQVNIQEKDETIKQLELALAEKERNQESSQRQLRQREEIEERLKEENWNLEVANQELRTNLSESNQSVTKHNSESSRLTKQLKAQSEQIDIMKAQEEKNASVMEAMKARHEQETYQLRRHAASAQRDNSQLQKQVETLNTELKICKAKLSIKLATTSRAAEDINTIEPNSGTAQDQDSESDQGNNAAPAVTISPQSRNQAMETETLKQSLAHAHRIISNLRSSYHKEKLEKFEIKKMLSDSQETIEQMSKEMTSWNANHSISLESGGHGRTKANGKKKPLTKKRRGGVARQPRGLCPNESDTDRQPESSEKEDNNDDDQDEEELPLDSEDDSTEDDSMTYFGNAVAGNTLDGIFANSTPFASIAMKPLSSELEAKVQVTDAGTNTDPVEFATCTHHHSSDSVSSPSTLIVSPPLPVNVEHQEKASDTRSDSLVVQGRNVPHFDNQEASETTGATITINAVAQTENATTEEGISQSAELATVDSVIVQDNSAKESVSEGYVQEQISKALIKERQQIAQRAEAILSPEQIETLLPKDNQSQSNSASRSTHSNVSESTPDQHAETELIPKSDVDKIIETAILAKTVDMVHKSKVEELIAQSVQEERAKLEEHVAINMIPKTEANAMVDAATEKANAAATETQKNMVSKAEADHLIQEARKESIVEAQKDMVTKTEADTMALAAVALATEKLIKKKTEEKDALVSEMISKEDAQDMVQQASLVEKSKIQEQVNAALEKQKSEFELIKKSEIEEMEAVNAAILEKVKADIEAVNAATLEQVKADMDAVKKVELDKLLLELDARKETELEDQKRKFESLKADELEKQRSDFQVTMQAKLDAQKQEIESRIAEIEKRNQETSIAKQAEIDALSKTIEAYKKESEENVQRIKTMLTKDSANVLIKRAVAEAVEAADKKHSEIMAGMISKEFALRMTQDEVTKALKTEREEFEAMQMISKAEAEALAKVAAADAIVKERQTTAAREKELITKEEAEALAESAAREAADKERAESALTLAKERKAMREKEERMIYKEEAEQNTKEAVRIALLEHEKNNSKGASTTMNNINLASSRFASQEQIEPPKSIERSVSTSRLALPSASVSPSPSVSTPASTSRKLKLSASVSSLRLGSGRKENNIQKSQRPSTESTGSSFGSFRILENTKYTSHRLQSKSSISLRDLSNKQHSSTSISTMSSEDNQSSIGRMHMPMRSDESFSGFTTNGGTDAEVISAITQTMIGEWMSKHTRRYVGGGISENKHKRFFWVHPYTGTLYWSSVEPGYEGNGAKAKSGSVSAVPSHDNTGSSPMSLLIRTPKRDLKITAPSLERHELWLKSLTFLLHRPYDTNNQILEEPRFTSDSNVEHAGHQQSINSATVGSKVSNRMIPQMTDVIQYDSDDSEDMVNIRQCCDGKHDVSTLSRGQHHHH